MTEAGRKYLTWQDLAEDPVETRADSRKTIPRVSDSEPTRLAAKAKSSASGGGIVAPTGMRLDKLDLPGELNDLLSEYQALEAKMRNLAGEAPADDVDERDAARFPVKTHTVESRIEDRRLARHDEAASLQKKAILEEAAIKRRLEARRESLRQQSRIAAISAAQEQERHEHLERAKAVDRVITVRAMSAEEQRRETAAREASNRALLAVQRKRRREQAHMAETGERARANLVSRRIEERDITRRRDLSDSAVREQQISRIVERRRDADRDEARQDAARARLIEQRLEAKRDEAAFDRRRSNSGR